MAQLYRSERQFKSLGQRYDIYADRFEFETLLGRWTIPFTEVVSLAVEEAGVQALVNGRLGLDHFFATLKLDCADVTEHVAIARNTGWARRVLLSPTEPSAFVAAAEQALARWRISATEQGADAS